MTPNASRTEPPQVKDVRGKLVLEAPWRDVEALQTHLRRQGIGSTICLEPWEKIAHLEIWQGANAAQVQAALESWKR
jgi:hypothetical protein